jgi:hypothetical protein
MSFFTKRNADETDLPERDDLPRRAAPLPNHPHLPSVQADTSHVAPAAPRGISNIGRTVVIKGDIHSDEDLQIEGQMEGRLELGQHRWIVASTARCRPASGPGTWTFTGRQGERGRFREGHASKELKISRRPEDGQRGHRGRRIFQGSVDITQTQSPR